MDSKDSNSVKHILFALIRTALFIALAALIFVLLSHVMKNKDDEELTGAYFDYPKGTFDVVFLGPSVMHYGVYPLELWENYGIASYNMSSANQTVPETYYLLKEIIERDHPKLIVYDTTIFKEDFKIQNYANLHFVADRMPYFSENRKAMIEDMIPEEDREEFEIPMTLYHQRWKNLKAEDFRKGYTEDTFGAKIIGESNPVELVSETPTDPFTELNDVPSTYVGMIMDLCKETGTNLLFTTFPIAGTSDNASIHTEEYQTSVRTALFVDIIAQFHGFTHINFLCHPEYLNLDTQRDTRDGHHLNVLGGEKMTAFLGAYIRNNYDAELIPDRRGDQSYAFMDKALGKYKEVKLRRSLITCNRQALYEEFLARLGAGQDLLVVKASANEVSISRGGEVLYAGGAEPVTISAGGKQFEITPGETTTVKADGALVSQNRAGTQFIVYKDGGKKLSDSVCFGVNESGAEISRHMFNEDY